jgi:hypothetical protein
MTRFLRIGNDLINVDQIRLIEEGVEGGEEACTITLLDGKTLVFRGTIDRLQRDLGEVVQASPGYTMLEYYGDAEAGHEVIRLPVVAWRVSENIAAPIAPNDEAAAHCGIYPTILMPDGRVVQQYGATWANETAWRASKDEEARRKRTGADAEEPVTDSMSVMFDKLMGKGRASQAREARARQRAAQLFRS